MCIYESEKGMGKLAPVDIEKIILEVRSGSDEAFSRLVDCYMPMIGAVVSPFLSHGVEYDEAFSEACFSLHRAAKAFRLDQKEVTFGLFARICIKRHLSSYFAASRESVEPLTEDSLSAECKVEEELIAKERYDALMSGVRAILSEYEYSVLLYHMRGYTTAQISSMLSRDAKSVDNAKNRIFRRLREHKELFSDS